MSAAKSSDTREHLESGQPMHIATLHTFKLFEAQLVMKFFATCLLETILTEVTLRQHL